MRRPAQPHKRQRSRKIKKKNESSNTCWKYTSCSRQACVFSPLGNGKYLECKMSADTCRSVLLTLTVPLPRLCIRSYHEQLHTVPCLLALHKQFSVHYSPLQSRLSLGHEIPEKAFCEAVAYIGTARDRYHTGRYDIMQKGENISKGTKEVYRVRHNARNSESKREQSQHA